MNGQSSIEFLIFISVLLMILAVFLWSDMSLQNRIIDIRINTEAKKLCDRIAFEINSAVRSGNGYSRKFYVEDNFGGVSDFDISVGNYSVFIDWQQRSVSSSIVVKNITNTNTINKGFNLIENRDGYIYVTAI